LRLVIGTDEDDSTLTRVDTARAATPASLLFG